MPPRSPGIPRPGAQALSLPEASPASPRRPSGPIEAREGPDALRALLGELGSQIRSGRGLAREVVGPLPCCPTGMPELDAWLGGGFPGGRLSELCGAPSSGRTALATALLAETLGRGALAAWIDPADAFDPVSTAEALAERGLGDEALRRLLWVRARTEGEAMRSCERILATEGFALTILDLTPLPRAPLLNAPLKAPVNAHPGIPADARSSAQASGPRGPRPGIREAAWLRLTRLAARQQSALVVLSHTPQTGSRAECLIELCRRRIRFTDPPRLLDAIETTAVLRRHRTRPSDQTILLSLDAEPALHTDPSPPIDPNPHPAPSPHADPAPQRLPARC